jgi:membrane protein YdbS with pleckstrin-like domain
MERRSGRGIYVLAAAIALFVVGWLAVKAVVTLLFYLVAGLLVVAGAMYLYRRARSAMRGDGRPRINRR